MLEPTTRLVFLGIICDTKARRVEVPKDKLLKLEVILTTAITSGWISFVDLERLTGKCTSMFVAVPPASLFMYHMYKHITKFRRTGGSKSSHDRGPERPGPMGRILHIAGSAPPYGWGIMVRGHTPCAQAHRSHGRLIKRTGRNRLEPSKVFLSLQGSHRFPSGMGRRTHRRKGDLCAKRGFPLDRGTVPRPLELSGTTLVVDLDNTTVFHAFRKGRAGDERMHDLIKPLS